MAEDLTPKIIAPLEALMGGQKPFCRVMHINASVCANWKKLGYTYSAATRMLFELDNHIEELQQARVELNLILKKRRGLRGFRFPPEK